MRNLNEYDIIFCDIDDTLIYGFWTDLMKHTWNIFRCNWLSDILMELQAVWQLYQVNWKLWYMLVTSGKPVVFLTARKPNNGTAKMITDIMTLISDIETETRVALISLQTDSPAIDKYNEIVKIMQKLEPDKSRFCLFDDNKEVRQLVSTLDIDVFDPTVLRYGEMVR